MSVLLDHLLSVLVLMPVAGAVLTALTRRESVGLQKVIGLAIAAGVFLLSWTGSPSGWCS